MRKSASVRDVFSIPKIAVATILTTVFVCVLALLFLASSVREEVDALARANSDTVQWSLAQTEVDMLVLQAAVHAAVSGEVESLADVRRRFDVFYSRIKTLGESTQFSDLRAGADANRMYTTLDGFITQYVPYIDGSDEELRAALPNMDDELKQIRREVRSFSLLGVRLFAASADERRRSVAEVLVRIGVLTFVLVVTLISMLIVLLYMVRKSSVAEKETAATRNRLQNVIATSIDAVLVVGRDGRVQGYNGAAERIFGYSREEAIGQSMAKLIIPHNLRHAHNVGLKRYRETGQRKVVGAGLLRLEAMRRDGSTFPADVVISSVVHQGEEVFVSYIRDVSQQVAAEHELVGARDRALAGEKAKAELLAVMSHEMRTPLNGLIGMMELLWETPVSSKQRTFLNAMDTSAHLLLHHVNNVLSVSSAESGQIELHNVEIDPGRLLKQIVESQRHAFEYNENKISYSVDKEVPHLWADQVRLTQIILNLVGNANKFTHTGDIVVEVDRVENENSVEFRVIDTGIGIAEEHVEAIFDDFRTLDATYGRNAEGTGLGLGIAKRLVEVMGGSIGVESVPGEGSVFWFRLPILAPKSSHFEKGPAKPTEKLSEIRELDILLVEDNEINRLVAGEMLTKYGHAVSEAHDGQEALNIAANKKFDLILMDISMPGIDGVTATDLIRREDGPNKSTPIIALTAHALPDDLERFRHAGMNDVLVKPLTREALNQVLLARIEAPATSDEIPSNNVVSDLFDQFGHEKASDLLRTFVSENDELVSKLADFDADPANMREMAEHVHKSVGSASVFQIEELSSCLKTLETVLREGKGDELRKAIEAYNDSWKSTRVILEDLLNAPTDATTI